MSQQGEQRKAWLTPTVRLAIYASVSGGLWYYGADLLESHPKPLLFAWGVIFLGFWFAASAAGLWLKNHSNKHPMPKRLPKATPWVIRGLALIACAVAVWLEGKEEVKPHLTVSLNLGGDNSSPLPLTNDFFFSRYTKMNPDKGGNMIFTEVAEACILVPIGQGESNKVFQLNVESDPFGKTKVSDLQVVVMFPKEWQCSADPKWHRADPLLYFPKWKVALTNVQAWALQSPWALYSGSSLQLPLITNSSIDLYHGAETRAGCLGVALRSSDFSAVLNANIIFAPSSPALSKPFITRGGFDSNGVFQVDYPFPL